MKTILNIIFLGLTVFTTAQNPNLSPFVGDWEWQNGNETFKVNIYIDDNDLKGNYQLVEINNGVETIIYDSNKLLNATLNFYYGYAIFGGSHDGVLFFASISDNVLLGQGPNDYKNTKDGYLGFTITNNGTNGQPITASWQIKETTGLKSQETPPTFTIPTDITLTKVN